MTTESDFSSNPLNPYQSYVVSASAGSGKTYQLSQRYLRLVAAGADPGDILTVTFTRKAAAEMQERIFSDAVSVLANDEAAAAIDPVAHLCDCQSHDIGKAGVHARAIE